MKYPWKYILVSLAIGLLLGGSVGLFSARDLARRWAKKSPAMFLKRMDEQLQLSDPQKTEFLAILTTHREKMAAYEEHARLETRSEIRSRLTADQQPKFDVLVAQRDAERRDRDGK